MGQYHRFSILNNFNEPVLSLSTRSTHMGAKLMEHSYLNSPYMALVEKLLTDEFYGYHLVWCGDYSDGWLYDFSCKLEHKSFDKLKPLLEDIMHNGFQRKCFYIVNITKKQYVDLNKCDDIHPLPLLCSTSNGRGGGDYFGTSMNLVGFWANDKIGVTDEIPSTFEEIIPNFKED